jgi:NAD(P)-dependent dehydrogenase (short-subunit alcohol dehydrogenase family)
MPAAATFAPLGSITEEQYDRTFGTNVKGTIFTVQKALPLLKDGGSVILTGSSTSIKGTRRSASTAPPRLRSATSREAGCWT